MQVLQNTRLNIVMEMADVIADGIHESILTMLRNGTVSDRVEKLA